MSSGADGEFVDGDFIDSEFADRGFVLDRFQREAIEHLDAGRSVLVTAPTGAGKTVVAEHAIDRALACGGRAFYTTPIKALSNQKFHDLTRRLGARARVGLLTGDNSVDGGADVVVMTTEVLRNMLYRPSGLDGSAALGSPLGLDGSAALDSPAARRGPEASGGPSALAGLAAVILDEVHYLQDAYRGPVWEEVILHLPAHVTLVCLSATVSNGAELGGWIRSVRGETGVVSETERPVGLTSLYGVRDRRDGSTRLAPILDGGRPNPQCRRFDPDGAAAGGDRRRRHWRSGRWGPPRRRELVAELEAADMLPALWFVFSRSGCEQAAAGLVRAGVRLTGEAEAARVGAVVGSRLAGFEPDELAALGVSGWVEALRRGVAVHHAGLVGAFKEAVEQCFVEGLVKVVFATETLALGVNMPARSVVIEKLTKFDGAGHSRLSPAQYTQFTGRAGRRGIDRAGYAVVGWSPFTPFEQVAELAASRSFHLRSAFRPTYNMAANLLARLDPDQSRRLLARSFAQYQADRAYRTRFRSPSVAAAAGPTSTMARRFDAVAAVLRERGHLNGWKPTETGALVARVYHEADLVVAEAVAGGLLDGLTGPELAAAVSALTHESRSPRPGPAPALPSARVRDCLDSLDGLVADIAASERRHGLSGPGPAGDGPPDGVGTRPVDAGLADTVARWAGGCDLADALGGDLAPGDFVRGVKQVADLLGQISAVARPPLAATAREALTAVNRGVVAASGAVAGP